VSHWCRLPLTLRACPSTSSLLRDDPGIYSTLPTPDLAGLDLEKTEGTLFSSRGGLPTLVNIPHPIPGHLQDS
jgi:hypothetical protein